MLAIVMNSAGRPSRLRDGEVPLVFLQRRHQRYFPVRGRDGKLMPRFIAVANFESKDPAQVRAGNERVVRPRLADAAFFYAADRKASLESRRAALGAVTFQAQLGSLADKVRPGHGPRRPDRADRGAGSGTGAARRENWPSATC